MEFYDQSVIEPELFPGESVLWTGQPETSVVFHTSDIFMIPFSLMWGGFALFWEAMVLNMFPGTSTHSSDKGISWFMALWGVPFILLGQYMIWGRFIQQHFVKKKTFYALTEQRAIVVQTGGSRKSASARLDQIPSIQKTVRKDGIGTLTFGIPVQTRNSTKSVNLATMPNMSGPPVFLDIKDAEVVYQYALQAQSKQSSHSVFAK